MKIVLLHGVNEANKRDELLKIKKYFSADFITSLDVKSVDLRDVQNSILATPLFGTGKRLVVLENTPVGFDLEKIPIAGPELYLTILADQLKNDSLLLKSAQKVKAKIISFEEEKGTLVFPFLDRLIERKKEVFCELEKMLERYNGIYLLSMIYYLLRRNILPLPVSSFLQSKIKQQKKHYQDNDWAELYKKTLEVEFKIKNGLISEKIGIFWLTEYFIQGKYSE